MTHNLKIARNILELRGIVKCKDIIGHIYIYIYSYYAYTYIHIYIYREDHVLDHLYKKVIRETKVDKLNKKRKMADEDRLLPIANVGRLMKQILPSNAKISKEAKQTVQECATEFISFVTCEASDKCHRENRKTVNGDDIWWALSTLGLDNYADAVGTYLHKYREAERERAENNKSSNDSGNERELNITSGYSRVLEKGSSSSAR